MATELHDRCAALVETLGLASADEVAAVVPLTGGVASDIASVDIGNRIICAKFALEKLRVAEDWHAPINRNAAEYAWLKAAGRVVPGVAPELLGRDQNVNGFAMEFIQGSGITLWKSELLGRQAIRNEASKVGSVLGQIHAASTERGFDRTPFPNQADFFDLRLEPYLKFTASVHPDLAEPIGKLVESQTRIHSVLIHGDISPKNILFRDGEPIFLDAECATMGDPSFDVAFCLNHLTLKAFHMPDWSAALLAEAKKFWTAYEQQVTWEVTDELEGRVAALLPALTLARIDGKSPVEYLSDENRNRIRDFARSRVAAPPAALDHFFDAAAADIEGR